MAYLTKKRLCLWLLVGAGWFGITLPAHAQLVDEGTGAGSQSVAAAVNDAGVVVGTALTGANIPVAYVAATTGNEVALPTLANDACSAGSINNNGAASQIVGSCKDANGVRQAVTWYANTPAAAPTVLQPLPVLLGLAAGIRTSATAHNIQGSVAGVSIGSNATATPVLWLSGSGSPTPLPVGLLGLTSANCIPADISDPIVSNSNKSAIIGQCPSDGGSTGKPLAVVWPQSSAAAIALLKPAGADYCRARKINVNGQVMGTCIYATDVYNTVRWTYPWTTAPIVLQTLSGVAAQHNSGIDMNASGQITGNYLGSGGFPLPFYWDPAATGTAGVGIAALAGGSTATATAIGDNGEIVGTAKTGGGNYHAVHSLVGGPLTDDGTLPGGSNSKAIAISPSGTMAVGSSEIAGHVVHSTIENLP